MVHRSTAAMWCLLDGATRARVAPPSDQMRRQWANKCYACHLITRRRHARARALRHLANITAIKDGGRRSVDHGSILKDTYFVLRDRVRDRVDRSRSKLIHNATANTGILRRSHNYLCFVHVCTQLGYDRSTVVRRGSANIGPYRGWVEPVSDAGVGVTSPATKNGR